MNKGRLEAFSDGVMAVIITIMVLELKAPQGADLAALRPVLPTFLQTAIIADQGKDSKLAAAVGRDLKGKTSALLYAAAIPLAFVDQRISDAIFVLVALIWLVPDPRIESRSSE